MSDEEDKVIDLKEKKLLKVIREHTGLTEKNSNIKEALKDAIGRRELYDKYDKKREEELKKMGINPLECYNEVCSHNYDIECVNEYGRPVSCIYRMITPPPNEVDYDEYMPSHKEALDKLELHGILQGQRAEYERASIYYNKARSQDERKSTEISNIDFNILKKCILEVLTDKETFDGFELFDECDMGILADNICLEVEKAMGIYPNIN